MLFRLPFDSREAARPKGNFTVFGRNKRGPRGPVVWPGAGWVSGRALYYAARSAIVCRIVGRNIVFEPGRRSIMRNAMALGLVAFLGAMAEAEPMRVEHRADLAEALRQNVSGQLSDLVEFYKDRHAHPELSLQEAESAGKIAERLERAGFSVTRNVGGHGVVGVLENGDGPTVLIRGDTDALPIQEETGVAYRSTVSVPGSDGRKVGVMHACGHDVHQTCLVGTASALAALRDRWRGTVVAIAQPAEEIGQGALAMIEDGLFTRFPRPDACIALHVSSEHPAGVVAYTPGWAMANVDSVDITVFGEGGHGSRPHDSVDPVAAAAYVVVALQTIVSRRVDPIEPAVITVGSIHAGSKHNIIPDTAHMQITVRSYTDETRRTLLDGIREVALHTCRALGCRKDPQVLIREEEYTPAAYNDPELTLAGADVLRCVVGEAHVLEDKPTMGGEDFGRYAKHLDVPGFMFRLGSVSRETYEASRQPGGPKLPPLHSSRYIPDPEPAIQTGVTCFSALALSLLARMP